MLVEHVLGSSYVKHGSDSKMSKRRWVHVWVVLLPHLFWTSTQEEVDTKAFVLHLHLRCLPSFFSREWVQPISFLGRFFQSHAVHASLPGNCLICNEVIAFHRRAWYEKNPRSCECTDILVELKRECEKCSRLLN